MTPVRKQDTTERPYLEQIKKISPSWQSLELLSDFMEIGTSPDRWSSIKSDGKSNEKAEIRKERLSRTNVTRLDYLHDGKIDEKHFSQIDQMGEAVKDEASTGTDFRLYILEDLSRDIIELFGSTFDIEPHFFREHIFDYAWYNTRDRPAYPPRFKRLVREQRWFQLRYSTLRYFRSPAEFKKASLQAATFNVKRRPDDDTNNNACWEQQDAMVAITRTRTSFWLNDAETGKTRVGG